LEGFGQGQIAFCEAGGDGAERPGFARALGTRKERHLSLRDIRIPEEFYLSRDYLRCFEDAEGLEGFGGRFIGRVLPLLRSGAGKDAGVPVWCVLYDLDELLFGAAILEKFGNVFGAGERCDELYILGDRVQFGCYVLGMFAAG